MAELRPSHREVIGSAKAVEAAKAVAGNREGYEKQKRTKLCRRGRQAGPETAVARAAEKSRWMSFRRIIFRLRQRPEYTTYLALKSRT